MDMIHGMTKWIDQNRYQAAAWLAVVVMCLMLAGLAGCQPAAVGLIDGEPVTRLGLERQAVAAQVDFDARCAEIDRQVKDLNSEIEAANARLTVAGAEIARQEANRAAVVDFIGNNLGALATGTVNPATLITPALGLAGLLMAGGTKLDSYRKDGIIIKLKSGAGGAATATTNPTTPTTTPTATV